MRCARRASARALARSHARVCATENRGSGSGIHLAQCIRITHTHTPHATHPYFVARVVARRRLLVSLVSSPPSVSVCVLRAESRLVSRHRALLCRVNSIDLSACVRAVRVRSSGSSLRLVFVRLVSECVCSVSGRIRACSPVRSIGAIAVICARLACVRACETGRNAGTLYLGATHCDTRAPPRDRCYHGVRRRTKQKTRPRPRSVPTANERARACVKAEQLTVI